MATEARNKKKPATAAAKKPAKAAAPKAADEQASVKTGHHDGLQGRRVVVGTVVSDKMQKTIVVRVDRRIRHSLYKKYVTRSRRFKAHDEKNDAKLGDMVSLVESRPLSREKRWALQSIIRRAGQVPEANV